MTSQLGLWEALLRTVGVTLALTLAGVLGISARSASWSVWRSRAPAMLTLLGWASYIACSVGGDPCGVGGWGWPAFALAVAFPFSLWWLGRQLLNDDLTVPLWAWAGLVCLVLAGSVAMARQSMGAQAVQKILAYLFIILAFVQVWRGAKDDLVESRRQLRRVMLSVVGAYSAIVLAAEMWLAQQSVQQPPAWLLWLHLLAMNVGLMLAAAALLRPSPKLLAWLQPLATPIAPRSPDAPVSSEPVAIPETRPHIASPPRHDVQALAARLHALMTQERLHQDSALSLLTLAQRLVVPEYVLRSTIHQGLGQRNFASFVNGYRLDEVATHLREPLLDRRPILTLALEAGFGSIGPFNRAFRERFSISPTQYRQQRGV
jgi:AraC-like DNA-binding protein